MARIGVRIGVNALYLIPGGVGGTEIYLRELLAALAELDQVNEYLVFTNLETQSDLVPKQANFHWKPQAVHARFRPGADLVGANRAAVRSGPLSVWTFCLIPDSPRRYSRPAGR